MLQVTLLDTSTYAVAIQAHVRIVSYVVAGPEGEGHLLAGMASIEDEDLAAVGRDADRVEDTRHAQPLLHRLLPAPCPRPCRSVVTPGSAMRLTACRFLRSNSCPFLRSNSAARAMRGRYLRIRHLRIRYLRIRYLRIEAPLWHLRCRLAGWTRPGGGGGGWGGGREMCVLCVMCGGKETYEEAHNTWMTLCVLGAIPIPPIPPSPLSPPSGTAPGKGGMPAWKWMYVCVCVCMCVCVHVCVCVYGKCACVHVCV